MPIRVKPDHINENTYISLEEGVWNSVLVVAQRGNTRQTLMVIDESGVNLLNLVKGIGIAQDDTYVALSRQPKK